MRFVVFLNLFLVINCCEEFWKKWRNDCSMYKNECYKSKASSSVEFSGESMRVKCGKETIDYLLMRCLKVGNIEKLQISDCYASQFDVGRFSSGHSIKEVTINNAMYKKNFESITFVDMPSLKRVKITRTFELVNLTFNNVPSFNHLTVNKYTSIAYEDRHYVYGKLNISPKLFNGLPKLQYLDLSYNNIEYLQPSVFRKLTELEYLSLRANEIKDLPGSLLRGLSNLRLIVITGNRDLNNIPSGFLKGLINLTEFYAALCSLSEIQEDLFSHAINLQTVDLGMNKIEYLPVKLLKNNKNLEGFHSYECRISTLPKGFFHGLSKLKKIDLMKNRLENLEEDSFLNLPGLEDVNLSENRITILPENIFFPLTNLRLLSLHSNNLKNLSGRHPFGSSKHLYYVNFKNTSLKEWPAINWTQYNLRYVDFSFNRFETVKLPIYTPNRLEIKLSDCKIKTVYIDDRKYGINTARFDLRNNPIECLKIFQNIDL